MVYSQRSQIKTQCPTCRTKAGDKVFFYPMQPQPLIHLPASLERWTWQPKLAGWKLLALGNPPKLYTRRGHEITDWIGLEHILRALKELKFYAHLPLLEGELILPYELPTRIPSLRREHRGACFVIFDIPLPIPFHRRLRLLRKLSRLLERSHLEHALGVVETFHFPPACAPETAFDVCHLAQEAGFEGIVLKHLDGVYQRGIFAPVLTPEMLKLR